METLASSRKNKILGKIDDNGYLDIQAAPHLYDLLMEMPQKGRLLEIGTGRGDSAEFFSQTKPDWLIFTVDGYGLVTKYKGAYGISDLEIMLLNWRYTRQNIIPIIHDSFTLPWDVSVDVLYIDGDHKYEAVQQDFNKFSPWVKQDGYVIFDDYGVVDNSDFGVNRFVNELTGWDVAEYGKVAVIKREV